MFRKHVVGCYIYHPSQVDLSPVVVADVHEVSGHLAGEMGPGTITAVISIPGLRVAVEPAQLLVPEGRVYPPYRVYDPQISVVQEFEVGRSVLCCIGVAYRRGVGVVAQGPAAHLFDPYVLDKSALSGTVKTGEDVSPYQLGLLIPPFYILAQGVAHLDRFDQACTTCAVGEDLETVFISRILVDAVYAVDQVDLIVLVLQDVIHDQIDVLPELFRYLIIDLLTVLSQGIENQAVPVDLELFVAGVRSLHIAPLWHLPGRLLGGQYELQPSASLVYQPCLQRAQDHYGMVSDIDERVPGSWWAGVEAAVFVLVLLDDLDARIVELFGLSEVHATPPFYSYLKTQTVFSISSSIASLVRPTASIAFSL